MYCQKCGAKLEANSSFCPHCGTMAGSRGKKAPKKASPIIRIILIVLTLVIILPAAFFCFVIFSSIVDPIESENSAIIQTEDTFLDTASDITFETADPNILVDNEFFTATFIDAQDQANLGVFYVTLKIENKSDVDIHVSLEDADVDGEAVQMLMTGVPLVIHPGNSGQTGFIFPMSNLSITSMSEAESASFRIVLRNNDTFDVLCESDLVSVTLAK